MQMIKWSNLKWILLTLLTLWTFTAKAAECDVPAGNSHDDYEREQPLLTAVNAGFTSVDIDVFYIQGQVRVCGNYTVNCGSDKAFDVLYLDALAALQSPPSKFIIRIDTKLTTPIFKSQTIYHTYTNIAAAMAARPALQSWVEINFFGSNQNWPAPSGNPSYITFQANSNYPFVNAGWPYTWNGNGTMPAGEESDLAARVGTAHAAGDEIMFASYPIESTGYVTNVWDKLQAHTVDWVSTDDPAAYADWVSMVCAPPEPDARSDGGSPDAGSPDAS